MTASVSLPEQAALNLPPAIEQGVYRIAQEALTNAARHAGATQLKVALRSNGAVSLTVADNGRGFDVNSGGLSSGGDHMGLQLMRERAAMMGGVLDIASTPGAGTPGAGTTVQAGAAMIRVLLCDDQAIVTEGLRVILRQAGDIDVVAVAEHGLEAVEQVAQHAPGCRADGSAHAGDERHPGDGAHPPGAPNHARARPHHLRRRRAGSSTPSAPARRATLLKDAPREQLIAAIRGTAAGGTHIDPKVAGKLFHFVAQPAAMHRSRHASTST
jgi:CheY-like chemotaxis protein